MWFLANINQLCNLIVKYQLLPTFPNQVRLYTYRYVFTFIFSTLTIFSVSILTQSSFGVFWPESCKIHDIYSCLDTWTFCSFFTEKGFAPLLELLPCSTEPRFHRAQVNVTFGTCNWIGLYNCWIYKPYTKSSFRRRLAAYRTTPWVPFNKSNREVQYWNAH